jgi:hypothetical protein
MTNDERLIELKGHLLDVLSKVDGQGLNGVTEELTLALQEAYELGKEQGWMDDWEAVAADVLEEWDDEERVDPS